jgi:alanyl-tRNA synthetase
MSKSSKEIRDLFINYWTNSAEINAKEIPNVSLVPNNDPTLLFVNSGMFPVNPYLSGQPHPLGTRLVNFQRCLRTNYDEMLEIGDNRHTLMFEMMGVWSLGDFDKTLQIPWIFKFWVEECGMDPHRIFVSIFEGDDDVPRDDLAIQIWQETFAKYGIQAEFSDDITKIPPTFDPSKPLPDKVKSWKYRIFPFARKKNWWQRAADAPGELGGPTSEMFYDMGEISIQQDNYNINDDSGRFIEIGNNVFMEYKYHDKLGWKLMEKKNIDFGGGFERVVMIVQNKKDIFETDIFMPIISEIEKISGKSYKINNEEYEFTKYFRILADHIRAATFILADGVKPSNKDQGYILRRFIRRLIRYSIKLGITDNFTNLLAKIVIDNMSYSYTHLKSQRDNILAEITNEEIKFRKTLSKGLKEISKLIEKNITIDGKKAFNLYETYGFPVEMILDELNLDEKETSKLKDEFDIIENIHREKSRQGAEKKFKGGLADQSIETTKLHTVHHILLKALQTIVSSDIKQKGSNITAERLRIDFNYNEKITDEQIINIENLVNKIISDDLRVVRIEMPKGEALKINAQMEFGQTYPDIVSVYIITDQQDYTSIPDKFFSAEFCGGPHVSSTSEIAKQNKKFKIIKQENIGSGIRRIKAILENTNEG